MQIKTISLFTIILTFGLLLLSAFVHQTSLEGDFEFLVIHRLLAAFVSLLTMLLLFLNFKRKDESERHKEVFVRSGQAMMFIFLQAVIGWMTLKYNLPGLISIGYFILSVLFFSTLIFLHHGLTSVEDNHSWRTKVTGVKNYLSALPSCRDGLHLIIGLWLLQIVMGGIVRHSGSGLACGGGFIFKCIDPFNEGAFIWPSSLASRISWFHKVLGMVIGLLSLLLMPIIIRLGLKAKNLEEKIKRSLIFFPILIIILCCGQVIIGFFSIESGLGPSPRLLHLGLAVFSLALLWKSSLLLGEIEKGQEKEFSQTKVRDFVDLTKPKLGALVMLTSVVGLLLTTESIDTLKALSGFILITMVVMGATSLNCYMEKDIDALMERTKDRALPAGRLRPFSALVFGSALFLFSLPIIYFYLNPISAWLSLLAAFTYLAIYTPMKKMSPLAVYVGAIPGAIPPVLGWTMVTGRMDPMAWFLFIFLFVWQIPHFMAISIYRADDYRNASLLVYSNEWSWTKISGSIAFLTFVLFGVSLSPHFLVSMKPEFLYFCLVLNFSFFGLSLMGLRRFESKLKEKTWARHYFLGSIIYLPLLLGSVILLMNG